MKRIVIIGAGPAALTAAAELAMCPDIDITVIESSDKIGGISRTERHNGNHIDIGGHRFFSKNDRVNAFWQSHFDMKRRPRLSRIFYKGRFFDYPVSLSLSTIANMGVADTLKAAAGYAASCLHKRTENNLEDFYINRFGKRLYHMFFESYTEKVWGRHPSAIGADWGNQRVKGLSIRAVIADMLRKSFGKKNASNTETSLIDQFLYPPQGPGQLWESVADSIGKSGVAIKMNTMVCGVEIRDGRVRGVKCKGSDGMETTIECDAILSSMPVPQLVAAVSGDEVPGDVARIAAGLPFRDFMTVGLLIDAPCSLPDNWIYIQDASVRLGRVQVFNNWSDAMVAAPETTTWLGLEYFCNEGDEMWNMADEQLINLAKDELTRIGLIGRENIVDAVCIRAPKAYPAYFGTYSEIDAVRRWADSVEGLYCIGRNGQHRYNNMDHSMLTAMYAADHIKGQLKDKSAIWQVNADDEYHESR